MPSGSGFVSGWSERGKEKEMTGEEKVKLSEERAGEFFRMALESMAAKGIPPQYVQIAFLRVLAGDMFMRLVPSDVFEGMAKKSYQQMRDLIQKIPNMMRQRAAVAQAEGKSPEQIGREYRAWWRKEHKEGEGPEEILEN
jgi:hypothetical protein